MPRGPCVSGAIINGRTSGTSRPEGDLHVRPADELEQRPRVGRDLARVDVAGRARDRDQLGFARSELRTAAPASRRCPCRSR